MGLQYTLVGSDDGSSVITVFVPGQKPLTAQSDHPNFEKIVAGVMSKDESVAGLFDVAATAATKFERLSDRVTSAHGRLFLDGEEINNALATQVVRFVSEGVEDYKPLVNFFENVQMNPNEHSREQLYTWLGKDYTLTQDGMIVGYKGVRTVNGEFVSINSGRAIVDGEVKTGQIPNHIGAVVEMPRNEVEFDPAVGCHTGLHVGTYDYANGFAQGALLEVHVHPRDVVSVPTDCSAAKMRVCRYKVVNTIDKPYTAPLLEGEYDDDADWGDGEGEYCIDCGQELVDGMCPDCDANDIAAVAAGDAFDKAWANYDGNTQTATSATSDVQAGDRFHDLDKRRNRVVVVTQVDGDTVHYETEGGKTGGTVSLKRLLTPYRFRRL